MLVEEEFVNPVHNRLNKITEEIENQIDKVCTHFYENTPNPDEFELLGQTFTASIATAQSGYHLRYRQAQAKLELYKAQHAKILHIVRAYYLIDTTILDNKAAIRWGYLDGVRDPKKAKIYKPDLDYYIQQDDLYIAATRMLAAQQRLVDTYKDIDTKLIERGRQYKTAMEMIKYKKGG